MLCKMALSLLLSVTLAKLIHVQLKAQGLLGTAVRSPLSVALHLSANFRWSKKRSLSKTKASRILNSNIEAETFKSGLTVTNGNLIALPEALSW